MDQQIRARFHDAILQAAQRRYGIGADQIRPLDAFESFVYEFERDNGRYILRLSHSLRRSEALIEGEVDWINYLAAGGVSVARAVRSENGKLVEAIDDGQGGQFLATAFVKAEGRPPRELWSPTLYAAYGQLLGRMHALAVDYELSRPEWRRPEWDDDMMDFVRRYLPASEAVATQKYQALLARLRALPKDNRSYGLIHNDANGGNFLVDDTGRLTLFDFDECAYSWYANDVAIALFYIVMDKPDAQAFTRVFMTHFLQGYRRVHPLGGTWLREIPGFLKLREIEMYAVIHRDFDVEYITDPWCKRFMLDRKYRIEHDAPYIEFDFETLAADG